MKLSITTFIAITFAAILGINIPHFVHAQTVSVPVSNNVSHHQQEVFTVPVLIESPSVPINAFTITATLPDNLTFVGSDDAGSIVSLWIETPHAENNVVSISAIIPTGFTQLVNPLNQNKGPGLVTKLILKGTRAGDARITFSPSLYANDGSGTKLAVPNSTLDVVIDDTVAPTTYTWNDTRLPETFAPTIEHNATTYNGAYVVVFSTSDKDSGISHYEVKEGNGSWFTATSPYRLRDQTLSADISVKAVDKAGNERIATVHPQLSASAKRLPAYVFLLVIVVVLAIFFRKKIFIGAALFVALIGAPAFSLHAATLGFSPSTKSVELGKTVAVDAVVSSSDKAINVVSGKITFDRAYLQPVSVSKSGSIVKFWIQEPTVNGATSTLIFEGVILNPGYTGSRGQIVTVTFSSIKEGETNLAIADGVVLANDGVGTNVFSGTNGSTITVLPKAPVQEEVPPTKPTETTPPIVPPTTEPVEVPIDTTPKPVPFKILSYPENARSGMSFVVDGTGGEEPIQVYAVRADLGGPLSGTILYKNLTEGGYDFRTDASVRNHSFRATFAGMPAGRYALYARDEMGQVTKLVFIDITSSFWQNPDITKPNWFIVLILLIALATLIYWLSRQRNNLQRMSTLDQ